MLGGLGFILGMSLTYIILFAIFLVRYFSDAAIPAGDAKHCRLRTISIVLAINFCAVMVYLMRGGLANGIRHGQFIASLSFLS